MYDPYNNHCTSITDKVPITDIDYILNEALVERLVKKNKTEKLFHLNARCHHGKINKITKLCICDSEWDSTLNESFPIVSTVPIHMCTIRKRSEYDVTLLRKLKTFDFKKCVSFT